eukprot:GILK01005753.1.p1 GENE.GILK01005753.1~~GILK01005753.1.p1  ORF type:complete len:881 (-),score=93.45 GILK01005753.1:73-2670(-)
MASPAQADGPPVWTPDEAAPQCFVCQSEFSFTFRRHHCRECGQVVCRNCSKNKLPITLSGSTKPKRVCDACFKLRQMVKKGYLPSVQRLFDSFDLGAYQVIHTALKHSEGSESSQCDESPSSDASSASAPIAATLEHDSPANKDDLPPVEAENEVVKEHIHEEEKRWRQSVIHLIEKDEYSELELSALQDVLEESEEEFHTDKGPHDIPHDVPLDIQQVVACDIPHEEGYELVDGHEDLMLAANTLPHLRFVILTVGSRGDVQPFVALGKELMKLGHKVRIATHKVFEEFVKEHDMEFWPLAGDPAELMAMMVQHDNMFSYAFVKDGLTTKRTFIKELLDTAWEACSMPVDGSGLYSPDVIIANPPSFAGLHIAEKLGIPLYMAFTMPWSRTKVTPSPFFPKLQTRATGGRLNYLTYSAVDRLLWAGIRDMVNTWRTKSLGLVPIATKKWIGHRLIHDLNVPFLYCFSPSLLPRPSDWGSSIDVSGFWFLDEAKSTEWQPPPDLKEFLEKGEPPVFIGFGSIVVADPDKLTRLVMEAARISGRRCLVQQGWAGMSNASPPPNVMMLGKAPHDWLFPRCAAVVHHGGAGTTAAGLSAGKPTVIVPFFGDQYFWGRIVSQQGVGPSPIPYNVITAQQLAVSIEFCFQPEVVEKAAALGDKVNTEDGVAKAVKFIHRLLPLGAMACDLECRNTARFFCPRCDLKLCWQCDSVVHCHPLLKNHSRDDYRSHRWDIANLNMPTVIRRTVDGARRFARGLYHGLVGVIRDPIEEVKHRGPYGAVFGIGKGLAGIAVKPVKGLMRTVTEYDKDGSFRFPECDVRRTSLREDDTEAHVLKRFEVRSKEELKTKFELILLRYYTKVRERDVAQS